MRGEFKVMRFFVIMAALAFIVGGMTAFFTARAVRGTTPDERAGYSIGARAAEAAPAGAPAPTAYALHTLAEEAFAKQGQGNPMVWKGGFQRGYEERFKKTHR